MATKLANRREKKLVLQQLNAHILGIKGVKANIHTGKGDVRSLHVQPSKRSRSFVCELTCHDALPLAQSVPAVQSISPSLSATHLVTRIGEEQGNDVQLANHLDVSCSRPPTDNLAKIGAGPVNLENLQPFEPRSRYLARKHLGIWVRHTFGRKLPHMADQHHSLSLERKVFGAWREAWWCARWEWKLAIRADCHNRYRLWLKVWKVWSLYVKAKKEKKGKKKLAEELAAISLERRVWLAWCGHVGGRRQRYGQMREAQEWSNGQVTRLAWNTWRRAIGFSLQQMAAQTMACQSWTHTLQRRVWNVWLTALQYQRALNSKVATSHLRHNHALLQKTLGAWLHYSTTQRDQAQMRCVAQRFHVTCCLTSCWDVWRGRFQRSRQMAKFAEVVLRKGKVARERRVFACWKLFREIRLNKRALQAVTSHHYSVALKRKVLMVFRSYTKQQLNQREASLLARQFALKKSLAHWWVVWMRRCEASEDAKQLPLTEKASLHYQQHLICRVTGSWMEYVKWRGKRRSSYDIAHRHFKKKALPRYFAAMREFVVYVNYKREMLEGAQKFREASVLKSYFGMWCASFRLSQDVRMMERMAILHREETVKRHMLKAWKQRTKGALKHLQKEGRALRHYHHCVKSGVLSKWRQYVHMRRVRVLHQQLAIHHCSVGLLKKTWGGWTAYVLRKRDALKKKLFASKCHEKALLTRVVQAWKTYLKHLRAKKAKTENAVVLYRHHLSKDVLLKWLAYSQYRRRLKMMKQCSVEHWRLGTTKTYFHEWWQITAISVGHAREEEESVVQAIQLLNKVRLAGVLKIWRDHCRTVLKAKENEMKAFLASARTLKKRCLVSWLSYHHLCIRNNLLKRQSTWFHNVRLLSSSYSVWRVELMHAVVLRQKNKLSLWYWSHALQRKALLAWLMYWRRRKRKTERYSVAMETYRIRLLTAGARCWIQYAATMQDQRLKKVLHLQAKGAQATIHCVKRCAVHWREVCRRRRLGSGLGKHGELHWTKSDWQDRGRSHDDRGRSHDDRGRPHDDRERSHDDREMSHDKWNKLMRELQGSTTSSRPAPRRPSYLHTPPDELLQVSASCDLDYCIPLSKSSVVSSDVPEVPSTLSSHCVIPGESPCTPSDATYIIASVSSSVASGTVGPSNPSHLFVPLLPSDDIINTVAHQTTNDVALMRHEIMQFYHLKTIKKSSQERMRVAVQEQDKTKIHTLQQQLNRIEEQLEMYEPRVRALTAKIQLLLSNCA